MNAKNAGKTELWFSSAWLLLGIAVALKTAGAIGLHFSNGFTLIFPTVVALSAFALAVEQRVSC